MAEGDVGAEDEQFRSPLGVTAEDEDEDLVRVCVIIPGLKKKFGKNEAANAEIDLKLGERSLDLVVRLSKSDKGKSKTENYRYQVKQLPDVILEKEKNFKVKTDQVVIMLKKEKARSWARELSQSGLETLPVTSSEDSSGNSTE